ncbi:Hypothetical protein NTJ_04456 [Nesidiocoris tenuis]|uniref:Uncharacterized protein n=1 Tax=Nesidiocoris tenuis TaxID=355587 RepID=A0ABN7AHA7_9HEMI|nr:Hypothetical protein NTJ_04456 [Nesidiocoris tenuis]
MGETKRTGDGTFGGVRGKTVGRQTETVGIAGRWSCGAVELRRAPPVSSQCPFRRARRPYVTETLGRGYILRSDVPRDGKLPPLFVRAAR